MPTPVRISDKLYELLVKKAEQEKRSITKQLETILEKELGG